MMRRRMILVNVCRWAARVVGTLVWLMITMIAVGKVGGAFNPLEQSLAVNVEFAAMLVMWAGLITAWKWEGVGSGMILGGFALFWLAERRLPVLNMAFGPLLAAGLLYLAAWRGARTDRPGPDRPGE